MPMIETCGLRAISSACKILHREVSVSLSIAELTRSEFQVVVCSDHLSFSFPFNAVISQLH